jgi:2',3'-cyclic-nucleotide 2'-phosphodiesterase (5'-nucleotidase family)
MIESLDELPLRVLNLAPQDLFLWPELIQRSPESCQIISTNLRPKSHSLPAPPRKAIVELDGIRLPSGRALRLGFLGVSDPGQVKPNSGFQAIDPNRAVADVLGKFRGEVDILIVLADLAEPAVESLVESNSGIDIILRAERRYIRNKPKFIANTLLLSSVERARYLGQLTLLIDGSGRLSAVEPNLIEMRKGVLEDPNFLQKQEEVKKEIH